MYLSLRERIADELRRVGYRVLSPFRVPLGWVDLFIPRKRIGIDIYAGSYESCVERLLSYPFRDIYIIGDCEGCISLEDFCRHFGVEMPEMEEEKLDNPSSYVKAIEDALAYLYIAGEVYEKDIRYRPLEITLADLKRLGFAVSSSKPKLKPEMFLSLTHDGYIAAKKIVGRRILRAEKKLNEMACKLSYVIALGISQTLRVKERFDMPEDCSLKSLLVFMKKLPVEDLNVGDGHPKALFCNFLVNSVLNEEAVKLVKKLNRMGLAFKIKTYSPYGHEMGEEYRVAREAVEALLKFSHHEISRDVTGEFLAVTYPLTHADVHPILGQAQMHLATAEKAGVCRIDGSKIILSEKFPEYARVRLAMLAEKVIKDLF
ncbi:hypothetical protein [Archaeoglobus neptunius]|uniref:hypothetical protein n=1 Tax=Archaeoglobus neptunius TaxID=2798580 RepID=UPI00192653D9|nr:hypothetical protein [Archaeoglobus neptunius]